VAKVARQTILRVRGKAESSAQTAEDTYCEEAAGFDRP
jgi:hypothetical protein